MATPFSSSLHYRLSSRSGNMRGFDVYHNSVDGRSFLQEPLTLPIKRLAALPTIQTVSNMGKDSPQSSGDDSGGGISSSGNNVKGQVRPPIRRTYATEMLRARPAYLPAIDEDEEEGGDKPKTKLTKTKSVSQAPRVKTTSCTQPPAASSASSSSDAQDHKAKTSSPDSHNQQGKPNNKKAINKSTFPEDDRKRDETKRGLNMETLTANPLANLQSRLEISLPTSANQGHGFESLLQQAIKIKEERAEHKQKSRNNVDNRTTPESTGFEKILPGGKTVRISHLGRSRSYAIFRGPKQESRIKRVPDRKIHELWKMNLSPNFEDTWSQHATYLSGVRMSHFGIGTPAETKPDMEAKQGPALEAHPEQDADADADADSEWESGVESALDPTSDSQSESDTEERTEDMVVSKPESPIEPSNNNSRHSINVLLPGRADPITIPCVKNPIPTKSTSQNPGQTKETGDNPDNTEKPCIPDRGELTVEERTRLQVQAEVEINLKHANPLLNNAELTLLGHPHTISNLKYHHAVLPREGGRTYTSPRQGQMGKMIWRGKAGWCPPMGKSPLCKAWTPDEMEEDDEPVMKPHCLGTKDCMYWDCEEDMGF